MWRLFRGCGHSFHIQCLLPDIGVCKVCQVNLAAKIEIISKSCNDAVFTVDHGEVTENSDDEESEDESPFVENAVLDSQGLTDDPSLDDKFTEDLRKKIFLWRPAASPPL